MNNTQKFEKLNAQKMMQDQARTVPKTLTTAMNVNILGVDYRVKKITHNGKKVFLQRKPK